MCDVPMRDVQCFPCVTRDAQRLLGKVQLSFYARTDIKSTSHTVFSRRTKTVWDTYFSSA
jgi:hypothetical protein